MIDFTFPVYIDDLLGIIPFKVERDSAVIIRPFGWRVWLAVLGVTPLYLLSIWLADMIYKVGQMVVNYYFLLAHFHTIIHIMSGVIDLIIPNISDFPQRLQAQPCNNNQHKVGS